MLQHGEIWRYYANKQNEPVTRRQILYAYTRWGTLCSPAHQNKKWNGGCQGLGEGGMKNCSISVLQDENSRDSLHNKNVFSTTALYILKWLRWCICVYFTTT